MEQKPGYIYILTNPSFPDYVKIGYADDVKSRLKQLNRSESTPFAFRCYASSLDLFFRRVRTIAITITEIAIIQITKINAHCILKK